MRMSLSSVTVICTTELYLIFASFLRLILKSSALLAHLSSSLLSRKPEPRSPQPQATALEVKDGTPKKQKQCNCKNSRCLKL